MIYLKMLYCVGENYPKYPLYRFNNRKTMFRITKTDLKNKRLNKTLYQITDENFQRHLSSPSVNSIGAIEQLKLTKIQSIYKFNK